MSKPVIVCIPGPCQSPEIYVPLRSALYLDGYTLIPLSLPSIGNVPPPYDFAEDVIAVRQLIIELIEKEKDVILVMQGFSGITGSQAIHGLSKLERERQGTKGGVVRLVFIMGWTVPEGFQGAQREDVSNLFSYMKVDPANGICIIDPAVAAKILYNDLPPTEAEYWVSKLQTQSLGIFWSKTSYAAWRYIPSTFVLCGKDQCVDEEYARLILNAAREDGRHMIDTVERCAEAGHCPMLSKLEWTANMLRRAAGENI